jgi:hypothetical protein
VKEEKNAGAMTPESCESKQNSLSYEFFKKGCSGVADADDIKSLHQVMHQNTFSQKNS